MALTTASLNPRANMLRRRELQSMANITGREADVAAKARELSQKGSRGSLLGTGLGLLGAVGLSMLTGGAGTGAFLPRFLAGAKQVAASPILAGVAAGAGSYMGQKGKILGGGRAARELEDLSVFTDMGPGSSRFASELESGYGGAVKDLKGAALTQGIARGVQVGSLAGGAKQIFGKGRYGSSLMDWLKKPKGDLPVYPSRPLR